MINYEDERKARWAKKFPLLEGINFEYLGSGSYGHAFRNLDTGNVIKVTTDRQEVAACIRVLTGEIKSPYLCPIHSITKLSDTEWIIIKEYLRDLREHPDYNDSDEAYPGDNIANFVCLKLEPLGLHDSSPQNMGIDKNGRVKVFDFRISHNDPELNSTLAKYFNQDL